MRQAIDCLYPLEVAAANSFVHQPPHRVRVRLKVPLAAGVVEGLGLGHNALAALITRGLAEVTRLACAAGGRRDTLAGLSGLGDLVLTCTGTLSRNRHVGVELAHGRRLADILAEMKMIAEGVRTTGAWPDEQAAA